MKIQTELEDTIHLLESLLGENEDLIMRRFHIFGDHPAILMYFSNMADQAAINSEIMKSLMYVPSHLEGKEIQPERLKHVLLYDSLHHSKGTLESKVSVIVDGVLRGQTVVAIQGFDEAILLDTASVTKRTVNQPRRSRSSADRAKGSLSSLKRTSRFCVTACRRRTFV